MWGADGCLCKPTLLFAVTHVAAAKDGDVVHVVAQARLGASRVSMSTSHVGREKEEKKSEGAPLPKATKNTKPFFVFFFSRLDQATARRFGRWWTWRVRSWRFGLAAWLSTMDRLENRRLLVTPFTVQLCASFRSDPFPTLFPTALFASFFNWIGMFIDSTQAAACLMVPSSQVQ